MRLAPDEVVGDFVLFVVIQCFVVVLVGQFSFHLVFHHAFLMFIILAVNCEGI